MDCLKHISLFVFLSYVTTPADAMAIQREVFQAALDTPAISKIERPNLIIIFCDDLGYGDLGCYGSTNNKTPNIDRLSDGGNRFTNFYSSSPVCTPSRASLMTGCYPRRVGMHEDFTGHWVLIPRSRRGLNPAETTIAEVLKAEGYKTACIGKWHLGDQPEHLPTRHGFDRYFGIPYSNDMQNRQRGDPPLPLIDQEKVIAAPVNQATLTQRYTEETIRFIDENRDNPFFIYLPHTFPHLPLFASKRFKNQSRNGRYGDTVEEIDWSTGEIINALKKRRLREKTLVIFTSDNGSNGRNGGSNQPLAGRKGSTMEGGMRVPMIANWPGQIPQGAVCSELATTMDFLPTFRALARPDTDVESATDTSSKPIDGHNIANLLIADSKARSPYHQLLYYRRRQLQAIRIGDWKYHLPLEKTYPHWADVQHMGTPRPAKLIHLTTDLQETKDLAKLRPDLVKKFQLAANKAIAELGNENQTGKQQRIALTLPVGKPLVLQNDDTQ